MKCPVFCLLITCLCHQSLYLLSISSMYVASWLSSIYYLSVCPPTYHSVHLSIYQSIHSIYPSIHLHIHQSIYINLLHIHPFVYWSMYLASYYLLIMYHLSKSWWTSSNTALSLKVLLIVTIACKEKDESGVEWTSVFLILSSLLKYTPCYPSSFTGHLLLSIYTVAKFQLVSRVWLFATPWTVSRQVPPSMEFSRQEYWNRLSFPSPGDLPNPGIKPQSPALQPDSLPSEPLGKPHIVGKANPQFCNRVKAELIMNSSSKHHHLKLLLLYVWSMLPSCLWYHLSMLCVHNNKNNTVKLFFVFLCDSSRTTCFFFHFILVALNWNIIAFQSS